MVFHPQNGNSNAPLYKGKPRLIFIKGKDDTPRHPRMLALIRKAGGQLIRRRFENIAELNAALNASLVDYLEACGIFNPGPLMKGPAQTQRSMIWIPAQ